MSRFKLTDQHKAFITSQWDKISSNDMAKHCGCEGSTIRRYLVAQGLIVSKEMTYRFRSVKASSRTKSTPELDKFLKDKYLTIPSKRIGPLFGVSDTMIRTRMRQLGLKVPQEIKDQRIRESRIQKGSTPINKGKKQSEYMTPEQIDRTRATRFSKGQLPHNTYNEVGKITVRYDHKERNGKPYKYICINLAHWVPLHKHIWETENGPLPKGLIIRFKDGNSLNCDLSNLQLITREENMMLNTIQRFPPELKTTIRTLSKLKKLINQHGKEQN